VEASSELRFPIMSALNGSCFFDYGSDLDSGATVIGDPAGARNKPGRCVWGGQVGVEGKGQP
jgi:outer membrane protein insertion porin family